MYVYIFGMVTLIRVSVKDNSDTLPFEYKLQKWIVPAYIIGSEDMGER